MSIIDEKEIQEAIVAAETTLAYLDGAHDALSSAANWGIFDMFGGGFLASIVKRSKIDAAQAQIFQAQDSVKLLRKELADIGHALDFSVETDGLLSALDIFCDGLFVDWMVQDQINSALGNVNSAITSVTTLKRELEDML